MAGYYYGQLSKEKKAVYDMLAADGTVTLRYDGGVIVLIHHDGHDTAEYTVHSHQCG